MSIRNIQFLAIVMSMRATGHIDRVEINYDAPFPAKVVFIRYHPDVYMTKDL